MSGRTWGYWTEQKLDILSQYLPRFTTASTRAGGTTYLDLFAGDTENVSRTTGGVISGSSRIALETVPEFSKVVLFELPHLANRLEVTLGQEFPGRDLEVVAGDCNETISEALRNLAPVAHYATFALVDQYAAEVRWTTLESLAAFKKRSKFKTELWLLFAHSMLPRALSGSDPESIRRYMQRITAMFGTGEWAESYEAWSAGELDGEGFREELANLMRWRLQHVLGYAITHSLEMRNTQGTPLYRMIFATDNDAGDRIMSHIYAKAAEEQPTMRAQAVAARLAKREAEGKVSQLGLFEPIPRDVGEVRLYEHKPPTPPYRRLSADDT